MAYRATSTTWATQVASYGSSTKPTSLPPISAPQQTLVARALGRGLFEACARRSGKGPPVAQPPSKKAFNACNECVRGPLWHGQYYAQPSLSQRHHPMCMSSPRATHPHTYPPASRMVSFGLQAPGPPALPLHRTPAAMRGEGSSSEEDCSRPARSTE